MGVVYEATHLQLERRVALKVISPALATDPSFRERFKRESRAAASLHHPNIVTIHDAGEEDGLLYLAMELIEGPDLGQRIKAGGAMDLDVANNLLAPIADALDSAHARDLVHRDVKPGNILVREMANGPQSCLTDFGLTRHVSSAGGLTRTGQWIGTLDYVAPEQVKGEPVDGRADVYALACVYFETLSGSVPFDADNDIAKMWKQVNEPPPRLDERCPEIDSAVAEAISRGMSKDPGSRYGSASELASAVIAPGNKRTRRLEVTEAQVTAEAAVIDTDRRRFPSGADDSVRKPGARPGGHRRLLIAGLAALVGLAGGIFAQAQIGGDESNTQAANSKNLEASFAEPWNKTLSGEFLQGFNLELHPIKLATSDGSGLIRAGTVLNAAKSIDPLPEALAKRWRPRPRQDLVQIGPTKWIRYTGSLESGNEKRDLMVAMVPTSTGYQGFACQIPRESQSASIEDCNTVIRTLRLRAVKGEPIEPSKNLAAALGEMQEILETAESNGLPALRNGFSGKQAKASAKLGRTYKEQARQLRGWSAENSIRRPIQQAVMAMADALKGIGDGYRDLSSAAASKDEGAFGSASSEIDNGVKEYDEARSGLQAFGYSFKGSPDRNP